MVDDERLEMLCQGLAHFIKASEILGGNFQWTVDAREAIMLMQELQAWRAQHKELTARPVS